MEKYEGNILKMLVALLATLFHFLFGGWTVPLQVIVTLVAIDFITGTLAAHKAGKYNSSIGFKGVRKKVGIFIVIAVARMADHLLGLDNAIIQTISIYGFAAHEIGSFMENAGKLGWWVPEGLRKGLAQLKEKSGDK